jgi:CRP-like cAMP-binding protein
VIVSVAASGPITSRGGKVESRDDLRVLPDKARNTEFNKVIKQRTDQVRGFLLFSGISEEDCATIVAVAQERSYPRDKIVFFEGDSVRQVVLLISGSVKLSQTSSQGQEVILRMVGPGETLCVECFPKYTHCSTAQTMTPSTALVWGASQFESIVNRYPMFGRNISCVLLRTLNQLEVRFREICTEKVAPRLSSQLVRLVNQVGQQSDGHVDIGLSQRDLAQLTGTTLFTVSRLLSQWEEQGIVRPRRQGVVVLNVPALEDLSRMD